MTIVIGDNWRSYYRAPFPSCLCTLCAHMKRLQSNMKRHIAWRQLLADGITFLPRQATRSR